MTYEKIIILIGIIIGVFLIKKTNPNFLKGVLICLILSFGISFFENQLLIYIYLFSLWGLSLLFAVYSLVNRKWLNLIIGLFAFISFFFKLMHFPYANELRLSMIIPVLCYLLTFRKRESYKAELSVLTVFAAYEVSEFLKMIKLWF